MYTTPENEKALLLRLANGDQEAFSMIVDCYRNRIYAHALTFVKSCEDAEEITQDIFLKVWDQRHRMGEIENFKGYLFILSRNQLISAIRRRVAREISGEVPESNDSGLLPDEQFQLKETGQLIQSGIERLPPQQKAVFTMHRFEQLSYEEISQRLHISKSTVKFHIILALNSLREHIRKHAFLVAISIWMNK